MDKGEQTVKQAVASAQEAGKFFEWVRKKGGEKNF
jgi:hypothetical protein